MALNEFINKYYIQPIYDPYGGYNFANSITYGLIAVALLFLIYRFLERAKIKIDLKFFWALFPFVLLGSSARVLVDKESLPITFWTVSPGIYLAIAGIFLATLVISYLAERKTKFEYWKTSFLIGSVIFIVNLVINGRNIKITELKFGALIIFLAVLIFFAVNFLLKKFMPHYEKISSLPLFAHLLDASATFVAVDFLGFVEKHPLPTFFIDLTGTAAVMYALKLAVLIPAIYYLHKDIESENLRNFFFVAIAVLGLAEGIRDLIAVALG